MSPSSILMVSIVIISVLSTDDHIFNVMKKIKSGLKIAENILSSEHSKKVANLVSEALGKHTTENKKEKSSNIFSGFLRLFGFDSKKMGAIAVNAIIVVAKMISSSIYLRAPSQLVEYKSMGANDGSVFDWVVNNTIVASLMSDIKKQDLSEYVIDYIKERSLDEDTGCIQLLICRGSPFVRKMQETIINKDDKHVNGYNAIFKKFPTTSEVMDNSDVCEKKHPYCTIDH